MEGRRKKGIIIFLSVCGILSILMTAFILYANNIVKIFKQPEMNNAEVDLSGYDFDGNYSSLILKGEWEFFHNKWIVTDGVTDIEPDGLIKVQSRWSGKVFNEDKLDRTGYASYRMRIKNAQAGKEIVCLLAYYGNAYRTYINGELSATSGVLSKNPKETFATSKPEEVFFYKIKEGETIEIVIELSADNRGGLYHWPTIQTQKYYTKDVIDNNWFGTPLLFITLGFIIPITIIIFILNAFNVYDYRNYSLAILMFVMVVRYVFSFDVFFRLVGVIPSINYSLSNILAYCSCFILFMTLINVFYRHRILVTCQQKTILIIFIANVFATAGYFLIYGSSAMYAFLIIPILSILYFVYEVSLAVAEKRKFAVIYLILLVLIIISFTLEISDMTGLWPVNIAGIPSLSSIVIMLTILIVYLGQIKERIKESRKARELEKQISDVKNKALKAQIKPHFIFNMLTNIQDQYHKEINAGDAALAKFSKHLRLNVDSEYKDMIPFEEELDNIQNYFDLENIRNGGTLNLLYDIEYTEFGLPILSLQPLVENAVKYAKTEEKEDGYIQIRSYQEENTVIVEVNDNGVGFDPEKVRENATGLKNITERLKYSLNAEVFIDSKIGFGTKIRIILLQINNN